ncbi:MAG TPA: MBL fold metallo-hydrolase, partial [Acidimicrobiales bacterium]|nr:MBL fold metallo-hydrolase [Acidimicrobiales bacterium]
MAQQTLGSTGGRGVAEDEPFSITVLGTDGSYPGPGGACSGYLLRAGGFATWMDAGSGTMANLQTHISLADLGAVVVSHSHPDHWSDLEGLYIAMRYFVGRRGLPVYAPAGLRDLMRGETPDGTLDWRVVGDGESAQVGPARWSWSRTDHPVETLAARVEVGGRAL